MVQQRETWCPAGSLLADPARLDGLVPGLCTEGRCKLQRDSLSDITEVERREGGETFSTASASPLFACFVLFSLLFFLSSYYWSDSTVKSDCGNILVFIELELG